LFVRPDGAASSQSGSSPAGATAGGSPPPARASGKTAEERQREREESGPVTQTLKSTASFRLVDRDGEPIPRKSGTVVFADGREVPFTSGATGEFFIGNVEPGSEYKLVFED